MAKVKKAKPKAKAKKPVAKKKAAPKKQKKKAAPKKQKKKAAPKKKAAAPKPKKKKAAVSDVTVTTPIPKTRVKEMAEELSEVYEESPLAAATPVHSTTTLVQTVEVPAAPAYVYRAFLDSEQHSKITGGGAKIDARVGGKFTAWDGYISGTNLELVEGERIVQSWRTSEWPDDYDDSRLEITLAPSPSGGTKLTMVHDNVPSSQAASLEQGWIDNYWEPLRKFFAAVAD
jgi:uncharacterized protein YndB with AHSA1/START domain